MSSQTMKSGSCGPDGCSVGRNSFNNDPEEQQLSMGSLITIIDESMLQDYYPGDSMGEKISSLIEQESVVIIGWSHCPYCLDVRETLSQEIGVRVHVIETDEHVDHEKEIVQAVQKRTGSKSMPYCFILGKNIGGCDEVRTLQASGKLEQLLQDRIVKKDVHQSILAGSMLQGNDTEEEHVVIQLPPVERGHAVMPLFWFPPTVNHHVIRLSGCLSCILATASVVLVFFQSTLLVAKCIAAYLCGDFFLRLLAGPSLSLIAQIVILFTANMKPDLRPGVSKQFACSCGVTFALLGTIFYFVGYTIVGAVFMSMLAFATGVEGFGDFCLGCFLFGKMIRFGFVSEQIYHVHTASRPELIATYKYMSGMGGKKQEFKHSTTTNTACNDNKIVTDPDNKIGLTYRVKSNELRNEFHVIRNMQVGYFGMPTSLAALAAALKLASDWGRADLVVDNVFSSQQLLSVPTWWSGVFGILAALAFCIFFVLYGIKTLTFPLKCIHEWDCPLRSCQFGYISTSLVLFSHLIYNWNGPLGLSASEWTGRVLLWVGGVSHTVLVVAKVGEFVGLIHGMEHVHTTWLILPVGSMVTAFIAPVVPMLANSDAASNVMLAQFFYSFALLLWITLFVVTFLKVVTTPNAVNARRNTIFMWITAPCTVGLASYSICFAASVGDDAGQCNGELAQYYFVGIMMLLCLAWAALPYVNFFGRDPFSMAYWSECFAFGMLAACAALFYGTNGYYSMKVLMLMALTIATGANGLAILHTLTALRRRRLFTPTPKWGPLAFMRCTHEGIRGAIPKLRAALEQVNLLDSSNRSLNKFASLFAQFKLVHEEHSRHENEVIFKTFNDYFPSHCAKHVQDHKDDEAKLVRWSRMIDTLLDPQAASSEKDTAFEHLTYNIPEFLDDQLVHMQGEEDHLQPIGKKYVPVSLQKQMVKECFGITSGDRWEVLLPYIIINCPHHMQRVRYLKCLCWAMPERSQQIGAIVYRHVDAVMWERLRLELPEIVPRGEHNWRRYY